MTNRSLASISLLSISIIAIELTWTRIFSAEFFYTFAFLILSLAVLGLGLGALALRLFPGWNSGRGLGLSLSLTGLCSLAAPLLVFQLGLDMSQMFGSWIQVGKFLAAIGILSTTFFCGGVSLAMIFKRDHQQIPRLYMADLVGAGLGVLLIIVLMNGIGTAAATFVCVLPVLIAAFLESRRALRVIPILLTTGLIFMAMAGTGYLTRGQPDRAPVMSQHWDAMALIKILDFHEDYKGLLIDNAANSPLLRFDGDFDKPDSLKFEFNFDMAPFIEERENCSFLSLGAGGGEDVLMALQAGATDVHAVEVIPYINKLMLSKPWDEFTGNIYRDPRVTVATEDARAYVRRFENRFDIIFSQSSNTFAALTSGAFAMAENYIFTREAFEDYWDALTDDGILVMEHQFYVTRLMSGLMEALENRGVADPRDHFLVYNLPGVRRRAILVSKQPLEEGDEVKFFGELTEELEEHVHLLYPPNETHAGNVVDQIVNFGWKSVADTARIDISPVTDNRPFVAQFGLWRNFDRSRLERFSPMLEIFGFPLSKMLILIILGVVLVVVTPLNLLPFLKGGAKIRAVPWFYFFTIGMAFMAVEVVLIQKYTLFIGPSAYSLAVILLALLLASGIGSRFAGRLSDKVAFGGLTVWLLLEALVFQHLTATMGGLPMAARIITTVILVAPLGFFMGFPFPKGGLRVGENIDWGFAVNGAASVLGSTAILLVAFTWGFVVALLSGLLLYLLAWLLLSRKGAW